MSRPESVELVFETDPKAAPSPSPPLSRTPAGTLFCMVCRSGSYPSARDLGRHPESEHWGLAPRARDLILELALRHGIPAANVPDRTHRDLG